MTCECGKGYVGQIILTVMSYLGQALYSWERACPKLVLNYL